MNIPCKISNIKLYEYPVNFLDMDGNYIDPFRYELAAIIKLQHESINRLIKIEFEQNERIEPGQDSAWIIDKYLIPHLESWF